MTSTSRPPLSLLRRFAASLLTAVVVAVTAHLGTVFVYSIAGSFGAEAAGQAHDYFLPASLFVFVLTFVLAAVGAFRFWYTRLAAAVAVGVVAPLAGTLVTAGLLGAPVGADQFGALFGTLATLNLALALFAGLALFFLGARTWSSVVAAPSTFEQEERRTVLVRLPSPSLADGLVTHIERTPVDTDLADEQWDAYVGALTDNGWTAIEVDSSSDFADGVFIEDTVVIFGDTAVITNPGAESRSGETAATEEAVRALRLDVARIEAPGTLEGGDVLKVGSTVYVGRGGRTNAEGIRQLRGIVAPLGYSVVAVPVTRALHLKTAVTALPDGTVIGYPPLVDDPALFDRFLAVPEAHGTAVVVLAPDAVLLSSAAPKTAAMLEDLGYRVVSVDISEFEKLEGCVTCLSVRLR